MSASVLEKRLRAAAKPDEFQLRCNDSANSNVWKHFLSFSRSVRPLNRFRSLKRSIDCVCNRCRRLFMYKVPARSSFGTKNLLDHVKSCSVYLCVRRMSVNFAA